MPASPVGMEMAVGCSRGEQTGDSLQSDAVIDQLRILDYPVTVGQVAMHYAVSREYTAIVTAKELSTAREGSSEPETFVVTYK